MASSQSNAAYAGAALTTEQHYDGTTVTGGEEMEGVLHSTALARDLTISRGVRGVALHIYRSEANLEVGRR